MEPLDLGKEGNVIADTGYVIVTPGKEWGPHNSMMLSQEQTIALTVWLLTYLREEVFNDVAG